MFLKDEDFPLNTVSFYLKYLIHRNVISLYDEQLEKYNKLLFDFKDHCKSHEEAMKIINYTISKMESKPIVSTFSYLKTSLFENLKKYRKFKTFIYKVIDESEESNELPF